MSAKSLPRANRQLVFRQLAELTADLSLPQARDPETRLRILTILGMLEVNYDSAMARSTWAQIETLAKQRHHYLLASRAIGEQGIAAFLLGDIATAKKDVVKAWTVAKVFDPAATSDTPASMALDWSNCKSMVKRLDRSMRQSKFPRTNPKSRIQRSQWMRRSKP